MSNAKMLITLMKERYGQVMIEEILSKCNFTEDDRSNVAMIFKNGIQILDDFVVVRRIHLEMLRLIDPSISSVYSHDNIDITEEALDDISSEVGAMKKILRDYE